MRLTFAVCNVGCKFAEFKGWYPAENSCLFNTNTVTARIPSSLQLFTDKHTVSSIIFTRLKNAVQIYTHKPLRIRPCITYCYGKSYARFIDFSISSVYVLFIYTVVNRLGKFIVVRPLRSGLKGPRGSKRGWEKMYGTIDGNAKRPKKISKRISETAVEPSSSSS